MSESAKRLLVPVAGFTLLWVCVELCVYFYRRWHRSKRRE